MTGDDQAEQQTRAEHECKAPQTDRADVPDVPHVHGTHGLADCSAESNGKDAQLLTYKIPGQFERDPDAPSVPRNEAPNHPREDHPLGEHADSGQLEFEAGHQLSHADQQGQQTRIEELHLPTTV